MEYLADAYYVVDTQTHQEVAVVYRDRHGGDAEELAWHIARRLERSRR